MYTERIIVPSIDMAHNWLNLSTWLKISELNKTCFFGRLSTVTLLLLSKIGLQKNISIICVTISKIPALNGVLILYGKVCFHMDNYIRLTCQKFPNYWPYLEFYEQSWACELLLSFGYLSLDTIYQYLAHYCVRYLMAIRILHNWYR